MTRLFTAYMRPLLEYASCVWSPCSIKDVKRIESVQRRFTMTNLSYTNRFRALGLDTLEHRRLQQDLLHTYKVLFGKFNIDHTDMFCIRSHSITRGHQWKLYPICLILCTFSRSDDACFLVVFPSFIFSFLIILGICQRFALIPNGCCTSTVYLLYYM